MTYRTRSQWLSLIAECDSSGLSQAEFCDQQGLNAKYFNTKRNRLMKKARSEALGFTRVTVEPPKPKEPTIALQVGRVSLQLDSSTPPDYLAQIIRLLA